MKNLWEIITGSASASAEDLAKAIIEIERKVVTFQSDLDAAEADALQLNKKKLCEEKVKDEDMDLAERSVLTARRNLTAAKETLDELKTKLNEAAAAKIKTGLENIEHKLRALSQRKKKAIVEAIKTQAQLNALQIAINGPTSNNAPYYEEAEYKHIYRVELAAALSQQEHPAIWEEENALSNAARALKDKTSRELAEELMEGFRKIN